ncbi:MAG: hypothetical protein KKC68_06925, partial [Candidatus Thermoplasmatota archaeon]|nr:hypothetical protein [Candidatus Thermoplasmatota archaeon]
LLMYLLFQVRLVFGGADAKALMALALLVPLQPLIEPFPLWRAPVIAFPGSWIIFSNSVILFLFIPLSLFIYNVHKRDITFPHCFLGYRMNLNLAEQKFVWPLEKIKDGKKIFSYRPSTFDSKEEYKVLKQHGIKTIWVTPKIPFMIPLLLGFITTFILGDFLTALLNALI